MKDLYNILVIEDDTSAGKVITFELKQKGHHVQYFDNAEQGLLHFQQQPIDLVLVDYSLPGMNGEQFFEQARQLNPLTPVIFMTAMNSVEKAVQLLKMGAFSYLTKPLDIDKLHKTVKSALDKISLTKSNRQLKEELSDTFNLDNTYVFKSHKMQQLLRIVSRAAASNSNVLITGESGTGKEVIAQLIHASSKRKDNALVRVNLSALPPTLVESELFGAMKGAFTGAVKDRPGKFEDAHKGTLFLDEIGELSTDIQVKLLRAIQEREITRLGSNKPVKLDIRLITATNKDLQQSINEKIFREDLFYRLNVIDIHLPPLKERKEDIPPLVDFFIKKFNQSEGKEIKGLSKDALNALMKYRFPGNIRELENIIERALVLAEREILDTEDLPVFVVSNETFDPESLVGDSSLPLPERLTAVEKSILEKTLKKHNFHQTNTAKELGISEGCLRYKIRTLGIPKEKV